MRRSHLGLAVVLGVYLALAGYSVVQVPLWETTDEAEHVELIRYIQTRHRLPTELPSQAGAPPSALPGNEFVQVPGYYLLLSVLLHPIWLPPNATWHPNPYVTWAGHPNRYALAFHRADEGWPYRGLSLFVHLARLITLGFGLVTLLASYALVRRLTGRADLATVGSAWLGWSPGFFLGATRVNNDAYAAAWSAVVLLGCVVLMTGRGRVGALGLAGLGIGLAGALLGKLSTAFLVPVVLVALLVRSLEFPVAERARLVAGVAAQALLVLALPVGLLAWWWLAVGRNFGAYVGQQGGFGIGDVGLVLRSASVAAIPRAIDTLALTWWGMPEFEGDIRWPAAVYVGLGAVTVLALALGAVSLIAWPVRDPPGWKVRLAAVVVVAAAVPLTYATIARAIIPSIAYAAHARFLLPVAPCFALLVALGYGRVADRRPARVFAGASLAALLVVGASVPAILEPRINAPWVPARLAASPAEASGPTVATFANQVDLLNVAGAPDALVPGKPLALDLRWRADQQLAADFTISVKLSRRPEDRLASLDAVPLDAVYPPRLWGPGEIVDQQIVLPGVERLPPGGYVLTLEMYRWQGQTIVPIAVQSAKDGPPASPGVLPLATWTVAPNATNLPGYQPVDARFGQKLQLTGLARAGPDLVLFWRAVAPISNRLVVSVQALDASGRLVAQHDAELVDGPLPANRWPVGALVRDDHALPPEVSPSLHQIVVVYDRQTQARLPVVSDGGPPGDHFDLPAAR